MSNYFSELRPLWYNRSKKEWWETVTRTGLLIGPNDSVSMPAVPAAQARCCLVARLAMCSAAQEFALGRWGQTHEAALLCADVLREIHCRDLKVLQWLTKWELGWQNDPVMLLRLGRRRGVGVLLQCVSELWEFVTERSRCERFRSWLSDVLADEECCFIPFPSMFSSKSNLPQLCIFLSYLRLLMACSFVSACSCCRHEEEGISLCSAGYWRLCSINNCTRKECSCPRDHVLWLEEDGQGVSLAYLELGMEPGSPEHLVQPPSYWCIHRLVLCSLLVCWFLIFGMLYILAAAVWKQLFSCGYSAGEFLNMSVQIDGMKVRPQVPIRSWDSLPDACGCLWIDTKTGGGKFTNVLLKFPKLLQAADLAVFKKCISVLKSHTKGPLMQLTSIFLMPFNS